MQPVYRRSVTFTGRLVCIARTMPSQDVCLFVRPSACHMMLELYTTHFLVTAVQLFLAAKLAFCQNGYKYPKTFLTIATPFQFFRTKQYVNIPTGTILTEVLNARGMKKIAIFYQYLALSPKRYKIQPQLLWKANKKPYQSFRTVPFPMTLSDPLTQISRSRHYSTPNNLKMVQDRAILAMADQQ